MRLGSAGLAGALALPAAMLLFLSFSSGGLFVDTAALVAVMLAALGVARVALAARPLEGMNRQLALAAGALALYAAWTLLSTTWSHAPARAMVEFDRTLIYLLALLLFGSFGFSSDQLRWLVRGLALAALAVCVAGFVSRTVPELWSADPSLVAPDRLSFPLTYWNALGAVAAMGAILCFHLTADAREPPAVRVVGAAALPLIAATLLLTLSRASIAVCVAGLLAYALMARPRGLLGGLLAVAPAVAVAVIATYRADDVIDGVVTAQAREQGHELAWIVLACVAFAALVRVPALALDRSSISSPSERTRRVLGGAVAALAVGALAVGLASGGVGFVERQYDRFVLQGGVGQAEARDRLTDAGSNGRVQTWEVALEGFRDEPLHGQGAGTYPLLWNLHRPSNTNTTEGHSLYLETLAELGLVGLALLALALVTLLVGTALRIRGPDRAVYAAILAAMLAWAVHAGADWLWEMPAVSLWVFFAGGAVLGSREPGMGPARETGIPARLAIGLGLLVVALTPALVGISQLRLNDGIRAFKRGDCPAAVDAALSSISVLEVRPEPYEILGYCDARAGQSRAARRAFEAAIRRDRRNWELHYGLALAQAAGGVNPRPAARTALRLNPRSKLAERAVQEFRTPSRRARRRAAFASPLPIP